MRKVVEVSGVRKSFGELRVLDKVDFYAEEGDFKVIVGENGSEKHAAENHDRSLAS